MLQTISNGWGVTDFTQSKYFNVAGTSIETTPVFEPNKKFHRITWNSIKRIEQSFHCQEDIFHQCFNQFNQYFIPYFNKTNVRTKVITNPGKYDSC